MKLVKFILVGSIFCLYGIGSAAGVPSKAVDISDVKWVTQNPPSSEDLATSVHVIEFWATWCGPCVKQLPHINSLAKEYEGRNVIFIGLSVDRSFNDVCKFVKKKNFNYNIGMDNGLSDSLNVDAVPRAFVFSHEGKLLWSGNPDNAQFEDTLKSAVKAAPEAMLVGVDLGKFSHLRIKLCGGKNFTKAYSELEAHSKNDGDSERNFASSILEVINNKLREKIAAAQRKQNEDPKAALQMYKEIIDNYGGIKLTAEVESMYYQLQKEIAARMPEISPAEVKAG